jgi:hypothetical protein
MSRLTILLIAFMMIDFFACEEDFTMTTDTLEPALESSDKTSGNNWYFGSQVYLGSTVARSVGQTSTLPHWRKLGAQYVLRNTPLHSDALSLPLPQVAGVSSPFEIIELSQQSVRLPNGKRRNGTVIEFFLPQPTIRLE